MVFLVAVRTQRFQVYDLLGVGYSLPTSVEFAMLVRKKNALHSASRKDGAVMLRGVDR